MNEEEFYNMMGGKKNFSYDMVHIIDDWSNAMANYDFHKANNIRKAMGAEKFGAIFDLMEVMQKMGTLPPPKE